MNNSDVLLQAANLTRCRPDGDARLLDDVSLSVCAGEKLSVTGASGSGKTLLLRALALLDPPDAGRVCYQGQVVLRDGVPGFRRAAIYLHQRPALLEETVEAALRRPFSLSVHRRKRFDRGRILEWLGRLGRSESFLGQRVGELSGGETQIVALLRALQLDPTILLLDEPTAALDPKTTIAVEELVRQWVDDSAQPRAIIWVTHDADQARRVAQTTVQMQSGRMTTD